MRNSKDCVLSRKPGLTGRLSMEFFAVIAAFGGLCLMPVSPVHSACPCDFLCGPRSLAEVCRRLGVNVSAEEIATLSSCDKNGCNMAGLCHAAKAKGLAASGMKIGVNELFLARTPAVAHLWGDHFVTVEGMDANRIRFVDIPAKERIVTKEGFQKIFSGFVLFVARQESSLPFASAPPDSSTKADLRFDNYVWSYGTIAEGAVLEYLFRFRNVGNSDLVIHKITPSCSCLICNDYTDRVTAGGVGQLRVVLNSAGLAKGTDRIISVESNDPVTPNVLLKVTGYVKASAIEHTPLAVDFGKLRKTEESVRQIFVPSSHEDPVEVRTVSCDVPWVKTAILPNDDTNLLGTKVRLTWMPGAPVGSHKGTLKIVSAETGRSAEVPLTAMVRPDVRAEFDTFFFGFVPKGSQPTIKVALLGNGNPIVVRELKYPRKLVQVYVEIEQQRPIISATLRRNVRRGMLKGNIIVHLASREQQQVTIPLCGFVK